MANYFTLVLVTDQRKNPVTLPEDITESSVRPNFFPITFLLNLFLPFMLEKVLCALLYISSITSAMHD
jgi:hypothetical protein